MIKNLLALIGAATVLALLVGAWALLLVALERKRK